MVRDRWLFRKPLGGYTLTPATSCERSLQPAGAYFGPAGGRPWGRTPVERQGPRRRFLIAAFSEREEKKSAGTLRIFAVKREVVERWVE